MTHDGARFRENYSRRQMFPEKWLVMAYVYGKITHDGRGFRKMTHDADVSGKWLTTADISEKNYSWRRGFPEKITHDGRGFRQKTTHDGRGFRKKYWWRQRFPAKKLLMTAEVSVKRLIMAYVSGKWLTTACFRENNSWRRRFPENDSWRRRFPEKWLITAGVSENRLMAAEVSEKADSWRQRLPENPNHDGRCFRKETGSRRQFPKKMAHDGGFPKNITRCFWKNWLATAVFRKNLLMTVEVAGNWHVGRSFRKNWLLIRRPWWPTIYNFPIASHIFEIRLATKCSLATASVLEANDLN